jgi:hypothetical protein
MSDHALTLNVVPVTQTATLRAHAGLAVATAVGATTLWEVIAVNMLGDTMASYPDALVGDVTWPSVSAPRSATFKIPLDAPDLDKLPLTGEGNAAAPPYPANEVQIWRNGFLLFWGPCVTRRANSKDRVWEYQAFDPLWYLLHRYVGQANRQNYLTNGNFYDTSVWIEATPAGGSFSFGTDAARYVDSPSSAQLSSGSPATKFIYQRFTKTSTPIGLALIVTAWVYIDTFVAPAPLNLGVMLLRVGASGPGSSVVIPIDATTARQQWVRLSGAINMPPSVTETIEVRLYSPVGTVHYDAVTVVIEESLSLVDANSPGGTGWDQVQIAQQSLRYLAGQWAVGPSYRKSRLEIAIAGADSGIKKSRVYQFFDHQPGYQGGEGSGILDEWVKAVDGFDYRIDITHYTRTFRTYYPAAGVTWSDAAIIFVYSVHETAGISDGESIGIVAWQEGQTIEGSATDVCEIGGWGSGAGREEGGQSYDSMADLTLELVETAPQEAPVDLLNGIAGSRANQLAKVLRSTVLTMVEPRDPTTGEVSVPMIGVLMPGDFIPLIIVDGGMIIDNGAGEHTYRRVTQVSVNADDVLTVAIDDGG